MTWTGAGCQNSARSVLGSNQEPHYPLSEREEKGGGYQGHISAVKKESRRIGYISSTGSSPKYVLFSLKECKIITNMFFICFRRQKQFADCRGRVHGRTLIKRITDGIGITGDGARLCKPGFLKVGSTNSRGSATGVLSSVADFMQRKRVCKFG